MRSLCLRLFILVLVFLPFSLRLVKAGAAWPVRFRPASASAAAWWGEGYHSPQWVSQHGGTLIYYTIHGKNKPDKYRARMYQGNRIVETEYGTSGYFDDALSGTYTIIAYKETDKFAKVNVSACPGGKIYVNFDEKKKQGTASGCKKTAPAPQQKQPTKADPDSELTKDSQKDSKRTSATEESATPQEPEQSTNQTSNPVSVFDSSHKAVSHFFIFDKINSFFTALRRSIQQSSL